MMKSEPRPFASLSSGLLARKGAARPAMRPQGFGQIIQGNGKIQTSFQVAGNGTALYLNRLVQIFYPPIPLKAKFQGTSQVAQPCRTPRTTFGAKGQRFAVRRNRFIQILRPAALFIELLGRDRKITERYRAICVSHWKKS